MRLSELLAPVDLDAAIEAGHVTDKQHPDLPLSILTYTAACQYANAWTPVTMQCRGLIVNDVTNEVVAWPFPKFFNIEEHNLGHPYAPPLDKNEPFIVQGKADGSLAIIFSFAGRWYAASKGSFASEQAQWAQKWLDNHDTSGLTTGVTYLAEMIYPENRIVVDYKGEESLRLLAVRDSKGRELFPGQEAGHAWERAGGSFIPTYDDVNLSKILFRAKRNQTFDGTPVKGTEAEGYVLRYASGLRVKVKLPEYVRLHAIITGLTERSVWEILRDGQSLKSLYEVLPDEYHDWLTRTVRRLKAEAEAWADERLHDFGQMHTPDPVVFAERVAEYADLMKSPRCAGAMTAMRDAMYKNAWAAVKPEATGPRSGEEV